jgi:hypothetical protein
MVFSPHGPLGRFLHRRMLARWRAAARSAPDADLSVLRTLRQQARQLQTPLQNLTHTADARLAMPRAGSTTFTRPAGTDWSWRPKAWRARFAQRGVAPAHNKSALSDEITVFHDCTLSEISLVQTRNLHEADLAPFGLRLEVFHFTGSFLSLVIEIPSASCEGLRKQHLIRLAAVIDREKHTNIYARLNVRNGPNTEQVLLTLPGGTPETMVEFDLAYSQINERRAERMWVDLMFENPQMNAITIRDLNISRYPRAEI